MDVRLVFFEPLHYRGSEIRQKKIFHLRPWEILQIQNLAYLPNSDSSVFGHYFYFMVTNSTFHDYFRVLKVIDIMYDKFFIECDGQK